MTTPTNASTPDFPRGFTRRRCVEILLLGNLWATATSARAFDLITPAEAEAEADAPQPRSAAAAKDVDAQAPRIRLVAPTSTSAALTAPVRIELRFEAAPSSRIDPASFKLLYGFLHLDVTDRIRSHAVISETALVADNAQLPKGDHRLLLQIADDHHRVGELELKVSIVD